MSMVTIYSEQQKKLLKTSYAIGGEGVAFDNIMQFRNFAFFHDIKITGFRKSTGGTILFLNKKAYKRASIDLILSGSIIENADDILVMQNGDYVLQQYKDNMLTSLYSGYHKKHDLVVDYSFARNLLSSIDFRKFNANIKRKANQIVIIEFINIGNKSYMAKNTTITIDSLLSVHDKKEFIKKYNKKYTKKIIMHNGGIFYILEPLSLAADKIL